MLLDDINRKLAVRIVRFVDEHQPGWVECDFEDANGHRHKMRDKTPIFSTEDLGKTSDYPRPGVVRCQVLGCAQDAHGRDIARITTSKPDGVESVEGLSEFVVFADQLSG